MRVLEQWWEESTPWPRPARQALFSLSVLSPSRTSKAGEVVYSLAVHKTNISTSAFQTKMSFKNDRGLFL